MALGQVPIDRWNSRLSGRARELAKLEALNLPGRRLRQFGQERDPARPLEVGETAAHELIERRRPFRSDLDTGPQDDEGRRLHERVAILAADHAAFEDVGMRKHCVLHFHRADTLPADLQKVVGETREPVVTVGVLRVLVASAQPSAFDGVAREVVPIPVPGTDRVAPDPEVADLAGRRRLPVAIENARILAGDEVAARARSDCARTIGNEHVQRFGRSDAVENLEAES